MKFFLSRIMLAVGIAFSSQVFAEGVSVKVGVMQSQQGEAEKYNSLKEYLAKQDVKMELVTFKNYLDASTQFKTGQVDAMFSGSGVAAIFIMKDLAIPIVRPMNIDKSDASGKKTWTTYWATIVAHKGAPKFNHEAAFFKDKKVASSSLASSGEFFGKAYGGNNIMMASSHGAALEVLNKKLADYAIIKNRVWDSSKSKYPNLEEVGKDTGENPDSVLIFSTKTAKDSTEKVKTALLKLEKDEGAESKKVKSTMSINGFIITTKEDYKHTFGLLNKAGIKSDFNF